MRNERLLRTVVLLKSVSGMFPRVSQELGGGFGGVVSLTADSALLGSRGGGGSPEEERFHSIVFISEDHSA